MSKVEDFMNTDTFKKAEEISKRSITEMVEMQEKAEKWDKLLAEDPDATIILADQLNEACFELDELRTKLEEITKLVHKQEDKINCDPESYLDLDKAFDELVPLLRNLSEILKASINNQEKRLSK